MSGDSDSDFKLDVGESWIFRASVDVGQTNIDRGGTIDGVVSFDTAETTMKSVTVTTTMAEIPAYALSMGVSPTNLNAPGTLTYTINVTNNGNMPLTSPAPEVTITQGIDTLATLKPENDSGDSNGDGKLDVGETWTYKATYNAGQDVIDNGGVIKAEVVFDTDQTDSRKGGAPALTMIDKGAGFDLR